MHVKLENVFVHVDQFGRVYFDKCQTDEEHILVPKPTDGDYRRCRTWMQDLLPKEAVGKKGTLKISIEFTPEES